MNKASLVVCVALLAGLTLGLAGQTQSGLAELHVQKIVLDPPSTVTRGEDVQIYARISNTGSRNANSFTVGFFYRPAREGEPWILLGTSEEEHLGPSQQDFLERTYGFETADMELGNYEIKVLADVFNQIPEVDELNNELTTSMELVASTIGLPELQPIQLAFEQTGTSEMDPWRITLVVENTGEYMLSSFAVLFLLDGQPMSIPMDPVTPFIPDTLGATTITGTLDPHSLELDPGTYLVTAVVDSAEQITEQDEGNNNISASLTIQTLELHPLSLRFDRSVVRLDEEVRVTSEIENTGSGLAKNVKVDFYIDHLRFASTQIDQLGAEPEEAAVTLDAQKLGLSTAPKVYDISVVVDPDNHLSESDEANNALMRTLTILEPEPKKPELHPESLKLTPASPAEIGKADIVTVTSVIKNTGRADAEAFDVGFYYRVKGGLRWDRFPCTDGVSCGEVTLSAGAQATLVGTLRVDVPKPLPPGIYEVRVAVDSTDLIGELDEMNNELVTTLTLLASRLPDLAVEIVDVEPGLTLRNGQSARVSAKVSNVGEMAADSSVVRFTYCKLVDTVITPGVQQVACADGYGSLAVLPDANVLVPPLGIGESTIVQVHVETGHLGPGKFRLLGEADPDKQIKERDETNNTTTRNLTVQGPDLTAIPGTFRSDPAGTPVGMVNQDDLDQIDFFLTVMNLGVEATGEFLVVFELLQVVDGSFQRVPTLSCGDNGVQCSDLPYFAQVKVLGLGAGRQVAITCPLDLSQEKLEPGQYVVRALVDCVGDVDGDGVCEGQIPEHVEINNTAEMLLTIVGGPDGDGDDGDVEGVDFSVEAVNGRASVTSDWITAYTVIANRGTGDSGRFKVEIEVTLPSGDSMKKVEYSDPGLAVGDQTTLAVQFRQGDDFTETLIAGERLTVSVRVLTNDGTPENNFGSRSLTVRN